MSDDKSHELVELIQASFGDDIAKEARALLASGEHHERTLLDLVALAERNVYERQAGRTLEALGREKVSSRIKLGDAP